LPIILNIDTATEHAGVCLSRDTEILALIESSEQKNHAAFVQPAIEAMVKQTGIALKEIDAVAVTAGPGSYTGLRVGLSSAKGICYALQKKLILINTLEVMAQALISDDAGLIKTTDTILCPMIDARRMEVFTAAYNTGLEELEPPHAMLLDTLSFNSLLEKQPLVFSGSGHAKLQKLLSHPHAIFSGVQHTAAHLAIRSLIAYQSGRFAELAYSEPLYTKEFFDPSARRPS
jgi:tRNA threonylcarbamoyladenosine biosynthesis protein TsaB